ncbi:MAG: beta-propeller domain-containing protein [Candidatus Altimarinota bacterium]
MKKLVSSLITLTVLATLTPLPPTSAQDTDSPFVDVYADYEYKDSIEYLKTNNIVQGYEVEGQEENQFRPDYQINRAELTKIMVEAQFTAAEIDACLEKISGDTVHFSDVKKEDWFAKYVCMAKEKGIIDGYPDGTFKPTQPVNFAEAAKIIANTVKLRTTSNASDEHWFTPFVRSLENRKGIPVSVRSFRKNITRGEMARMIHAAKETLQDESLALARLQEFDVRESELPQIDSCDALIEKLELNEPIYDDYYLKSEGEAMEESIRDGDSAQGAIPPQAPSPTSTTTESRASNQLGGGAGADDYSQTNVQVKGVDEADIVKNDGKYIYLIKNDTVRIVEAYPGTTLKELSTITLDDPDFTPQEIYVDDNQMVIIGHVYRYRDYPYPTPRPLMMESRMAVDIWPGPVFDQTRMKVYVYSITNRSNPRKQRSIEIEGNYTSSRKVGKNVYFVLNQYIPYFYIQKDQPADVILPLFKDSAHGEEDKPLVRCTGVQYFPNFQDRNYMIVAGLNIADLDGELNRKVVLGSSQNIYASRENLYVAAPHYREIQRRVGRDLYYENEQSTLVYRFKLAQDEVEYQNQGSVPGNILNQFSMDESGDTFRIATTLDSYNSRTGSSTWNNLYVLNRDNMNTVGKIEEIAPDERIKSVRFMGNRAYMVTFRNVDPLFVIDLSTATTPKILGELKIPGWSDYLHPFDETHLIGFGREVSPEAEDAEFLTSEFLLGMKLSIFDVTDVANPKETHKEVIGARGTTSDLLYNHKALLFDKDKKLLAFPITITEEIDPSSKDIYNNIQTVFSGGIVYSVDLTNGFQLKGKVTHYEDDSVFENSGEWFYGDPERMVQRMVYIGEYLYSISPGYIRSYVLDTVKSLGFIKLSGEKQDDVDYLPGE